MYIQSQTTTYICTTQILIQLEPHLLLVNCLQSIELEPHMCCN